MVRRLGGLVVLLGALPVVLGCLPGQTLCGHPHKDKCCGVPTGPVPPPVAVTVSVDPKNLTHQINPLFNGCHSDSGAMRARAVSVQPRHPPTVRTDRLGLRGTEPIPVRMYVDVKWQRWNAWQVSRTSRVACTPKWC